MTNSGATAPSVSIVEGRPSRYAQLQVLIALFKPRTIVEIGTNRGDSAVAMCHEALKHRPEVHYRGYDVFDTKDHAFHQAAFNGKGAFSRAEVHDRLASLQRHAASFSFELVEGDTNSTLHREAIRADFVFIDGDHRSDAIAKDYAAVADSEVVVFDDFYDPHSDVGSQLIGKIGCNRVVGELERVTILPLADEFPATGPIRMAVTTRNGPP